MAQHIIAIVMATKDNENLATQFKSFNCKCGQKYYATPTVLELGNLMHWRCKKCGRAIYPEDIKNKIN